MKDGAKKQKKSDNLDAIADFLFEAGVLAKTPRSWSTFLGSGKQSVAEHLNRATYIGYALAQMSGKADISKVIAMCMFHDFAEARVSDLNHVHQKYNERKEDKAVHDLIAPLPFGNNILTIITEYEKRETLESKLVKDADTIEFILSLKEQVDIGNDRARTWLPPALKRMKTSEGKKLAECIVKTDSDRWWFGAQDGWWGNKKTK